MVNCLEKMKLQVGFLLKLSSSLQKLIEFLYFFINEIIPDHLLNLLLRGHIKVAH